MKMQLGLMPCEIGGLCSLAVSIKCNIYLITVATQISK